MKQDYSPDILNCLANLSSDEVFTSPELANRMLDLLPQEMFRSSRTRFLDPCAKSGVFLREIAKRLLVGLETEIPDLQQRIDHIMTKQVFGIACTDLTAEMSRRTLYCSKHADGQYSITEAFKNDAGNVCYQRCRHTWNAQGRCECCGASKGEYLRTDSRETYAYPFIHKPIKEIFNMQFDVIIGNPPYQLSVGNEGGNSSKAKAIYHMFISQAIKLNPKWLVMITPSRWMTRSTEGIPDEWVDEMLTSNHFMVMHDFPDSSTCFPSLTIPIKGGVNYFLWEGSYQGKCQYAYHYPEGAEVVERYDYLDSNKSGIVIRDPKAYSVIEKIKNVEGQYFSHRESNFSSLVSPKDYFTNKVTLTSSWMGYRDSPDMEYSIKYYLNKNIHKKSFGFVRKEDVSKNLGAAQLHKVYIPAAGGTGTDDMVLGFPFYGEPGSVCSQTYLVIGYDVARHRFTKKQCENIISYIKTRLFRYLVSIKKKTQNGPRDVYQFVPLQDFSHPWTDEMLYKKYGLDDKEIAFIESMIRPME